MAITDRHFEHAGVTATTGPVSEALGGIAAIVLAILGLAHVSPVLLAAIATLAVGGALLCEGTTVASEYARLVTQPGIPAAGIAGGGWSLELLAGAAGIVLGVLALLNIVPMILVACAAIAFGGTMVLSGSTAARVNALRMGVSGVDERALGVVSEVSSASTGTQILAGLAAVVLGILALAGFDAGVLVLVAMLVLGASILLNGTSLSGAMLMMFRPTT